MNTVGVNPLLARKYNQTLPRYTSYPTVPFWNTSLDKEIWKQRFSERFSEQNHINGISLYVHLPFCESLCTYCGCNKKITNNHQVEDEYLLAIEKEWGLYRKLMKQTSVIRELHLGGGTPTFFAPRNLKRLIENILKSSIVHPNHEFSIEGHPNNTTKEHLKTLFNLGFRRISFGVQDNDPAVQKVINRIQPIENVIAATENARNAGFTSINFDLIYGLPLQTLPGIEKTMNQVIELKPDRIAFYSYAHVPWTSTAQRLFDEKDLPGTEEKLQLYLKGKELLINAGYIDIGMDHFALPHDSLYKAKVNGSLHRNFMGYTTKQTGLLLGLGMSAISDTGTAYAQNDKSLRNYYLSLESNQIPITKGYILNEEDAKFKKYILDINCKGTTTLDDTSLPLIENYVLPQLQKLENDQLVDRSGLEVKLTAIGQNFIRNVCAAFDLHLLRKALVPEDKPIFSKAI